MPIPHVNPTCRSHMPISDLFKGNHVGEVIRPRMIEGNAVYKQCLKTIELYVIYFIGTGISSLFV